MMYSVAKIMSFYPPDFDRRIAIAKKKREGDVNCLGFAIWVLAVAGKQLKSERYIFDNTNPRFVDLLAYLILIKELPDPINNPIPANTQLITAWHGSRQEYVHATVVKPDGTLIERPAYDAPVQEPTKKDAFEFYIMTYCQFHCWKT